MSAPTVHDATDLPALRLWLLEQWRPERPFWHIGAQAMFDSTIFTNLDADAVEAIREVGPEVRADAYSRGELRMLGGASLWWVTPDMCRLLSAAVPQVPDDTRLEDLPPGVDRHGLVMFEEPLVLHTREGKPLQVDMIVWGQVDVVNVYRHRAPVSGDDVGTLRSVRISTYQRLNLDQGLHAEQLQQHAVAITELLKSDQLDHSTPRYVDAGDIPYTHDTIEHSPSTGDIHVVPKSEPNQPGLSMMLHGDLWAPCGSSDWPVGDRVGEAGVIYAEGNAALSAVEDRKVLAAMWALVNQPTLAARRTVGARKQRTVKRAKHLGVSSDVRVVVLRKLATHGQRDVEPGSREWSHRWIVSGHLRNQPYGPGRSLRRLQWIEAHVKGPSDKPLRAPETVRVWKR